jgi:hypothetical protein
MLPESSTNNSDESVNSSVPLLQRRWLLAAYLGLMLAAAVGSGVFFFLSAPKHTVRTLLHVPPQRGIVFKEGGGNGDLKNHQRTQVAKLKSRLVLGIALRDPKVAKLSIVQEQIEPVEWLEKEVEGDFPDAPEILRISMKGDKPEQLTVLVDAIAQAYKREIVDNEKNKRLEKLNTVRALREKYEEQLRDRQRTQREIEQNAGGQDATARALVLSFERQNLAMNERQLLETQSKLREARTELELLEARGKAPEPTVLELRARIASLQGMEKVLVKEFERLRKVVQDLAQNGSKLDAFRDDLQHIENLTKRLISEEQALNAELEVPLEFKVLEEAQVVHAEKKSPMVMMVAGSAAAAFAVALLAVAFWASGIGRRVALS